MPTFLEDFRGHVAWGSAGRCKYVEGLFIHDPRQAKVGDEKICGVFWSSEEQILWLQIPMDDTMVVEICHSGQRRTYEICGITLVVATFPAYSIE